MSDKMKKIIITIGITLILIVNVIFLIKRLGNEQISDSSDYSSDYSSMSASISEIISNSTAENSSSPGEISQPETTLKFRNENLLNQHYQKHGIEMGFESAEEYEQAAARVPLDPEVLHKTEKDDGDDVYYIERTNEFVIVSTDGYLRTYFLPDAGIAYFERQ